MSTSPLICADCSSDRLISKLSMVPFDDLITAGGWCWLSGGSDADGTGMIPSAANAGSELAGSCTGIAVLLIAVRCACSTWAEADEVTGVVAELAAALVAGLYVEGVVGAGV